jgi:GPI ethanolamine phosphate transferase 2/3 subunit F
LPVKPIVIATVCILAVKALVAMLLASTEHGAISQALRQARPSFIKSSLVAYICCVCLGAPLTRKLASTTAIALFLAAISSVPMPFQTTQTNTIEASRQMFAQLTAVCTLAGAYLGAITMCLDANQPWQHWPLPVLYGSVIGFNVGATLAILYSLVANFSRSHMHATATQKQSVEI